MSQRFPDLEIYIKRIPLDEIAAWLGDEFELKETVGEFESGRVELVLGVTAEQGVAGEMRCTLLDKAVKGGFVSVWFKNNLSPWHNDLDCATAAYAHFQAEVRCSTGGWEGEDDGGWFRFTKDGVKTVNWYQ